MQQCTTINTAMHRHKPHSSKICHQHNNEYASAAQLHLHSCTVKVHVHGDTLASNRMPRANNKNNVSANQIYALLKLPRKVP
jgi:hypothetical protein